MSGDAARPKRFHKTVSVEQGEGGFTIILDGRPARTLTRRPLVAQTAALARAIADEWEKQGDHIDRQTMPLTGLLSASIDGDETTVDDWLKEILSYLKSDLLCYRAEKPDALVLEQQAIWGPYLEWFEAAFGAKLMTTSSVIAIAQSDAAIAAVEETLRDVSVPALFAIKTATAITGSATLALAIWKHAFSVEEVFEAMRLDERFQEKRWGVDAEAKAREKMIERELQSAAVFLGLL